ncbi:MAG TPA: hypothetical protein VF486_08800 [Actinomycetes bacterium]
MPIDELDRRLAELAEAAREHAATPTAAVIRARARRRRTRRLSAVAAAVAVVAALAVATRGQLAGESPDSGPSAGPAPSTPPSTAPRTPPSTAPHPVPWVRDLARPRAPTPTVPGARLADLAVSIEAPSRAVIGRPLRYSVTIANAGSTPLPLRPCPNYDQRLAVEGTRPVLQPWRLNCKALAAAAIGPGERVTFAMRLDVPATMPPGRAVLIWNLDLGPGAQFKPLQVVRP